MNQNVFDGTAKRKEITYMHDLIQEVHNGKTEEAGERERLPVGWGGRAEDI